MYATEEAAEKLNIFVFKTMAPKKSRRTGGHL